MDEGAAAIEVEGLHKHFRSGLLRRRVHRALAGVSFRVERGQVVGLIGPNGGGKTTTFGCLLGLLRPSAGRVRLFGECPRRPATRRCLGYLPETSPFPGVLTARQGLEFYGALAGLPRRERRRRAAALLARLGLAAAADRRLAVFSKGMLRRFGLAQALIAAPPLLLLDEPASGLDPLGARELAAVIAEERARGTTVLLASHELAALESLCDAIVLLHQGRVLLEGALPQLLASGSGVRLEVEGLDAPALAALRQWIGAHGGRLTAVEPRRERLGELFLRALERAGAGAQAPVLPARGTEHGA
ncbi:MAG: hypothetical protein KatS3mg102_1486 [Planctomycetota bacterium]|nr:MAG: hypothetical protein KatS3mg102_1486 [Planctomycetota bacterium]